MDKKISVKKQVDDILEAYYLPRYSEHIRVERIWKEICSFDIEEEIEISTLDDTATLHCGMRGWYPDKRMAYIPHFDIRGQLWSEGTCSELSEMTFELAVSTLEELGYKLDERYV